MASTTQEASSFLSIRGLVKQYTDFTAVSGTSLELRRGEMMGFLGPSGCGKTTTLRMLAGLITPTAGTITLDGRDITALPVHKRNIGLVFQSYALFPHMTVAENIAFGLRMRGGSKAEIADGVAEAVALVQLEGLENRRPRDLSGGQQQRVAVARAVITKPALLLLDEPLSNLDARLRDGLRAELRELQQRLEMTAIFVTHDQVEALSICDRVAVMNKGIVEQVDTPNAIYERPATPFVASFVGRINRLVGRGRSDGGVETSAGNILATSPVEPNRKVEALFRPHRIRLSVNEPDVVADNTLRGTITRVTYVGDLVHYEIAAGDARLTVERATLSNEPVLPAGTAVSLGWSRDDTLAFEVES